MNALSRRRGACPALSAPMETGDGLLVRLSPADGTLSCAALEGLAEAARAFGNGLLEVTARGSLQLRGLKAETVGPLNDAVNTLGIRAREGLAVDVSPLAGLDAAELADARPFAEAVRTGIAEFAGRLGPKVSVVIDGGGAISLDALKADVRLTALVDGTWDVALAGDATGAIWIGAVTASDAAATAVALLQEIASSGPAARMADVLANEPPENPLSRLRGRAREGADATSPPPNAFRPAAGPLPHPPPQAGEGADGAMEGTLTPIPLADGSFALPLALPFGVADADMISALAHAALHHGARDLRPAPPRTLLATGLIAASANALAEDAAKLGFILDPTDPRLSISACPGAPACASGRIAARALAPEIAKTLSPLLDGTTTIHVSGCAKGCARPAAAALTIVGRDVQGMDRQAGLVQHGTAADPPGLVLPERDLLPALARLAQAERRPGESGAEFLSRLDLKALLEPSS